MRLERIQWHNGGAAGVRSWKLYGVTKVHYWLGDGEAMRGQTLCGRIPRAPRFRLHPQPKDQVCQQCEAVARRSGWLEFGEEK